MLQEARELGMMPVAARRSTQDGSGQQRFPPQRDEPLPIEVRWMQGPDAHYRYFNHQEGLRSLTRANQRHIGINTAMMTAQLR